MYPNITIGINARYIIPAFSAFAGRSPICCAVLVQIEHCARVEPPAATNASTNTKIRLHFFMPQKYDGKS